jgi:hypothetical protein
MFITKIFVTMVLHGFLREKLLLPQLFKKFPAFYGLQNFITDFTRAHHQFLF